MTRINIAGWGGGSGNNFNAIMHYICGPGGAQFQGPVATQPTGQGVDEAVQSPAKPGGGGQAEAVCQRGHLVWPPCRTGQHCTARRSVEKNGHTVANNTGRVSHDELALPGFNTKGGNVGLPKSQMSRSHPAALRAAFREF